MVLIIYEVIVLVILIRLIIIDEYIIESIYPEIISRGASVVI